MPDRCNEMTRGTRGSNLAKRDVKKARDLKDGKRVERPQGRGRSGRSW